MLFIVRAGRKQSWQQLRRSAVPPPCKQVSHRSPSQSAPGRPPASWLSANTGLETQSPAQKTTNVAALAHHIVRQRHEKPRPPATSSSRTAIDPGCYRTLEGGASPKLLGQMAYLNPEFPLAFTKESNNEDAWRSPFLAFPDWRVRTTAHALPLQQGGERLTKVIRWLLVRRRDLHADWRHAGGRGVWTGRSGRAGTWSLRGAWWGCWEPETCKQRGTTLY